MEFEQSLQQGVLIRRYKRFMADIETSTGDILTAHCPNTGSMKNCNEPGSRVWYWDSGNPKRKYPHSWELVEVEGKHLACINTGRANKLVVEAIGNGTISQLQGYDRLRTEVKYGEENSRIDILLESDSQQCYVEVKNVTLLREGGVGAFPDAVSTRGAKHLRELVKEVEKGNRAVLVYNVAHTGINKVFPAADIDPGYSQGLADAKAAGVEVYAYQATIDVTAKVPAIYLSRCLPVDLD